MPFGARVFPRTLLRRRRGLKDLGRALESRTVALPPAIGIHQCLPGPSRYFSSSPTSLAFGDFFKGGSQRVDKFRVLSLGNAHEEYAQAAKHEHVETMQRAYDMIRHAMELDPAAPGQKKRYFQPSDLMEGMVVLSRINTPGSRSLLERTYNDIVSVFGFDLLSEHHSALAMSRIRSGRMKEAIGLLDRMAPEDVDWSQLLEMASTNRLGHVDEIVQRIRRIRTLNSDDYHMLLLDLRRRTAGWKDTDSTELDSLLEEAQANGVVLSPAAEAEVVRTRLRLGQKAAAKAVADTWSETHEDDLRPSQWKALCEVAESQDDTTRVMEVVSNMVMAGKDPPARTLVYLMAKQLELGGGGSGNLRPSGAEILEALETVERKIGATANASVWLKILNAFVFPRPTEVISKEETAELPAMDTSYSSATPTNLVEQDVRGTAIEVYRGARARGLSLDTKIARKLIVPLCSWRPIRLEDALEIYNDWLAGEETGLPQEEEKDAMRGMFQSLISALASTDLTRHVATAQQIFKEMEQQGVIPSAEAMVQFIIPFIRYSPTYRDAFTFYNAFLKMAPSAFTDVMYTTIIDEFLSLRPRGRASFCPARYPIDIMTDMQISGAPIPPTFYRDLVNGYGRLATETVGRSQGGEQFDQHMEAIQTAIDDLFTRYKLDPAIDLDPWLLNAILDAYNRVGNLHTAVSVWETLVEMRTRIPRNLAMEAFPAALAILFDLYGHRGTAMQNRQRAQIAWDWAKRHGFTYQVRTWNGRVENLCRMHQFTEAQHLVFQEMATDLDGVPSPTFETLEILVKFTSTWDVYRPITVQAILTMFPDMWPRLAPILDSRIGRSKREELERLFITERGGDSMERAG